ncbi:hypothetical protein FY034_10960 [Trichlorobacter lovleyi]|nr:hypothetical protein FY034_10960 [Trichlorobacter lovleyi]
MRGQLCISPFSPAPAALQGPSAAGQLNRSGCPAYHPFSVSFPYVPFRPPLAARGTHQVCPARMLHRRSMDVFPTG